MKKNPLQGWSVDRSLIRHTGRDLCRPECILAERDGTLWSADARGGVMRIDADGSQRLVLQSDAAAEAQPSPAGEPRTADEVRTAELLQQGKTLPNGMAFAANGDILIANFGTDALELMTRDGRTRTLHDRIDGRAMGKVNFVLRDSKNRIWITVSTRVNPWDRAICSTLADGYVALLDDKGLRVVADGLAFTNEIRLDAKEEYLYIAETTARRVTRMRVGVDGSLHERQVHGPASLGTGALDGITFDAFGNLWCTMIFADRLMAITPEGEALTLLDDGDPAATQRFETEFASGEPVSFETLNACGGTVAPWLASVTFGGADLCTCYLGSLKATTMPCFPSPVAGLPMVHW